MNIMLALCTHFLSTQTALLTLNIDPLPSLTVIQLVWLDPPLLPLTKKPSLTAQSRKRLIQHQCREIFRKNNKNKEKNKPQAIN